MPPRALPSLSQRVSLSFSSQSDYNASDAEQATQGSQELESQEQEVASTDSAVSRQRAESAAEVNEEGDTMIPVEQKLVQMAQEIEVLHKSLNGLQQKMLSAKGLKKKVLKKSCFDLDIKITDRKQFYDKLKANPTGETWGIDPKRWKAMQASKRLRGEI